MSLDQGGHLTHGSPVNFSGKNYNMVAYGLGEDGRIDYDQVRDLARKHKPRMILAGASAYPRIIDFKTFADIAHEVGAYLFVDMAHIAGLVAAGCHPSPIPYADVVSTTTHKTLRGPRGGMLLCNDEAIAKKLNSAIFPGSQGGPLEHIIAAKAVALGEALKPEFKTYQQQIVKNAAVLAQTIMEGGLDLVSNGTDNHLMLVDLRPAHLTGKEMEHRLDEVYITVNKNAIPNDPEKPFVTSGIGPPHLPGRPGRLRLQGGRTARPGEGAHRPLSPLSERLTLHPAFPLRRSMRTAGAFLCRERFSPVFPRFCRGRHVLWYVKKVPKKP